MSEYSKIIDTEDIKYSALSKKLTTDINKAEKKKHGIYFTPPETIIKK